MFERSAVDVLAHVVIARAFPEIVGAVLVVRERELDDPLRVVGTGGVGGGHRQTASFRTAASFQATPVPSVPATSIFITSGIT